MLALHWEVHHDSHSDCQWQYVAALIMCHVVGDFAFQSAWMAMEKAKSKEVLVYHVVTQASPFVLLSFVPGTHVTPQACAPHAVACRRRLLEGAGRHQDHLAGSVVSCGVHCIRACHRLAVALRRRAPCVRLDAGASCFR